MSAAGELLFARYAYAPNDLGYCGPADAAELFELGASGHADASIEAIARRFSGAWPYASLLAETTGVEDPLDERVMRAYWTGGPLLDEVERSSFGGRLLDFIGAQAGHYWSHLTDDLIDEVTPTHGFHVLGVYPWTRLLRGESAETPLHVLDNCRIRWGQVVTTADDHVVVTSRRLVWDGVALGLGEPATETVRFQVDSKSFVAVPGRGDWLTLHWDWVCETVTMAEIDTLERLTRWQLAATNHRLRREALADETGLKVS